MTVGRPKTLCVSWKVSWRYFLASFLAMNPHRHCHSHATPNSPPFAYCGFWRSNRHNVINQMNGWHCRFEWLKQRSMEGGGGLWNGEIHIQRYHKRGETGAAAEEQAKLRLWRPFLVIKSVTHPVDTSQPISLPNLIQIPFPHPTPHRPFAV